MKPQPKHQPLFFTPRTPWGTRLTGRSFFDHMKASDSVPPTAPDKKHQLSGNELKGLAGEMAPNQFGGSQGSAAQAGGNGGGGWKVQPYQTSPWIAHNPADMLKEKLPDPRDHALDRTIPQGLTGRIPAPDSGGPVLKAPAFVRPDSTSPQPGQMTRPAAQPSLSSQSATDQTARRVSDVLDQQQKNKAPRIRVNGSAGGELPGGVSGALGIVIGNQPAGYPPLGGPNDIRGAKGTETKDPDEEERNKEEDEQD